MKGCKQLASALLALGVCGLTTQAFAVMSAPEGWYLEGNIGSSQQTGKSYPGSSGSSGVGGSGNLGYKFMPYVGAELDYSLYPRTSIDDPSTGTLAGKDKLYSYGVAARGILPISDYGFELFGRLGAAQIRSSVTISNATAASNIGLGTSSHSAIGLYWGAGASYYFMPELAVNGQWARVEGSNATGNLGILTAGITFIFG